MTGAELTELATELGIDAIGAAPVAPYDDTERHIRDRRARGLFADMRFTMARPEVSCHPELLLEGAATVIAGALCYYREGPEPRRTRDGCRGTHGVTSTRSSACASTRSASGWVVPYRVLVDESEHVDRAGAVRAGVAFYGKNTMAITRRHGSWVVLGALVTEVEVEPSPPLELDCGECRLCIDACPTGALDEPGTLDATKCLSYWTQAPSSIPDEYRAELGAMVYGCDICQEVCPWNRGIEKRRRRCIGRRCARGRVPGGLARARRRRARCRARPPLRSPQRSALASTQRTGRGRERRCPRARAQRRLDTSTTTIRYSASCTLGAGAIGRATGMTSDAGPRATRGSRPRGAEPRRGAVCGRRGGCRRARRRRAAPRARAARARCLSRDRANRHGHRRHVRAHGTARRCGARARRRRRLLRSRGDAWWREGVGRPLVVDADPVRLRQVLDNLIANALTHAGSGRPVTVRVTATRDDVEIAVSDAGRGIPPSELARIFEPGVRLGADTAGSGLGLALSRAIVEAHGGTIAVDSTSAKGRPSRSSFPDVRLNPPPEPRGRTNGDASVPRVLADRKRRVARTRGRRQTSSRAPASSRTRHTPRRSPAAGRRRTRPRRSAAPTRTQRARRRRRGR